MYDQLSTHLVHLFCYPVEANTPHTARYAGYSLLGSFFDRYPIVREAVLVNRIFFEGASNTNAAIRYSTYKPPPCLRFVKLDNSKCIYRRF